MPLFTRLPVRLVFSETQLNKGWSSSVIPPLQSKVPTAPPRRAQRPRPAVRAGAPGGPVLRRRCPSAPHRVRRTRVCWATTYAVALAARGGRSLRLTPRPPTVISNGLRRNSRTCRRFPGNSATLGRALSLPCVSQAPRTQPSPAGWSRRSSLSRCRAPLERAVPL